VPRTILHLDLDAFYAAVEQRDKPSLRGKPVVVGGTGRRGVVATASYEARAFGVGSAMATGEARRRCPNAAYLAPRFAAYRAASDAVMALLHELSPVVEPLSLDEAYVDLTEAHPDLDGAAATALAERFRAAVHEATGLTASVGLGTSKLVAKIGSDLHKPDGLTVVPAGQEARVLAPLPVRRLPGVGAVTGQRLAGLGTTTIGDLAATDVRELVSVLGRANGSALHAFARGEDRRPVVSEREAKSVSAEETFATDLTDRRLLADQARRLADRVVARLGSSGLSGRTVTIKVRRYDFSTLGRSTTLPSPSSSAREITAAALGLLAQVDVADGVRLLGVGVTGLTEHVQQDLLAELEPPEAAPVADDGAGEPEAAAAAAPSAGERSWHPGQDVHHAERGAGWVQGSGLGRVTVRFEGPGTGVGPVRTYRADDADLVPAEPPVWPPDSVAAARKIAE